MIFTGTHKLGLEKEYKKYLGDYIKGNESVAFPRSPRPRWECLQQLISTIKITIKRYTEVYTPTLEHGSECIDK